MEIGRLVTNPEHICHRNGGFDVYAVSGNLYRDQNGKASWLITVVSDDSKGVNQSCVVNGNDFICREVGIILPELNVAIGEASDLAPDVRQGILALLRGWEEIAVTV